MSYMTIYEEFGCGADLIISETVSQVRKKENSLKFCTECGHAWQMVQLYFGKRIKFTLEHFWFGGGCIDKRDWIICPECKENKLTT